MPNFLIRERRVERLVTMRATQIFSSEVFRGGRAKPQELTRTRGGNDLVSLNRRLDRISRNIVEGQRLFADPD